MQLADGAATCKFVSMIGEQARELTPKTNQKEHQSKPGSPYNGTITNEKHKQVGSGCLNHQEAAKQEQKEAESKYNQKQHSQGERNDNMLWNWFWRRNSDAKTTMML